MRYKFNGKWQTQDCFHMIEDWHVTDDGQIVGMCEMCFEVIKLGDKDNPELIEAITEEK